MSEKKNHLSDHFHRIRLTAITLTIILFVLSLPNVQITSFNLWGVLVTGGDAVFLLGGLIIMATYSFAHMLLQLWSERHDFIAHTQDMSDLRSAVDDRLKEIESYVSSATQTAGELTRSLEQLTVKGGVEPLAANELLAVMPVVPEERLRSEVADTTTTLIERKTASAAAIQAWTSPSNHPDIVEMIRVFHDAPAALKNPPEVLSVVTRLAEYAAEPTMKVIESTLVPRLLMLQQEEESKFRALVTRRSNILGEFQLTAERAHKNLDAVAQLLLPIADQLRATRRFAAGAVNAYRWQVYAADIGGPAFAFVGVLALSVMKLVSIITTNHQVQSLLGAVLH